ncbi:MAG: hypothetical protein D4S01_06140, partial [Dehalococcoidia bacterium]
FNLLNFLDLTITAALVIAAVTFFVIAIRKKNKEVLLFAIMPILAILGYSFSGLGTAVLFPTSLFNIYLLVLSINKIVTGIKINKIGVVNIGMVMLAALIFARFFDSHMSFVVRGIIFIALGIGCLGTNVVLIRRKGGSE